MAGRRPAMAGHEQPWPAMADHGQQWLALACHSRPWPAMAVHCQPWPGMAGHGWQWPTMVGSGRRPWLQHMAKQRKKGNQIQKMEAVMDGRISFLDSVLSLYPERKGLAH